MTCIRCGEKPRAIRAVCYDCNRVLACTHWKYEYILYGRLIYILPGEEPSVEWLRNSKHAPYFKQPPLQPEKAGGQVLVNTT